MAGSAAGRELSGEPGPGIRLAGPRDDGELRLLLRRSVMPGPVCVAITREPDYFAAEGLAAAEDFTVVVRPRGPLVGMGHCSVNSLYRNGRVQRVAYLAELRSMPGTPATPRLLREAYAFLADTLAQASIDAIFTSVAVDNSRARRVLERGKALGLPAYRPLASLVTLAAPIGRSARQATRAGGPECGSADAEELTAFLHEQAPRGHLALAWNTAQWSDLGRRGVAPSDFLVVRNGARIAATAAVWDQRPFRQVVIDGYAGALRRARPLVNAVQVIRGLPPLPGPGGLLAQGAVLGASVSDPAAWPPLWRALRSRAASKGLSWLLLARDARDPHLPLLRSLTGAREYCTTLYDVAWAEGPGARDPWDARQFRPEVGLL